MKKHSLNEKNIAIVINPSSGQEFPILARLNEFFSEYNANWDIFVTKRGSNRFDFKKYDIIVVYGGDGTFTDVARQAKEKPILMLHGGTANTIPKDLGIPGKIDEGLKLLANGKIREMDSILANRKKCFFKVAAGSYIKEYHDISREDKDKMGYFAYIYKLLEDSANDKKIKFKITIDKRIKKVECQLLAIANNAGFGIEGLKVHPDISAFDGKLDLLLLKNTKITTLSEIAFSSIFNKSPVSLVHKKIKDITIESDKKLLWLFDEEYYELKKVRIKVQPGNISVLVPKKK
jgi:diacylglycerol kinase family enzyme